jgi:maltose O-acetyltransferase
MTTEAPEILVTSPVAGMLNYVVEIALAILPPDPLSNAFKRQLLMWRGAKVGRNPKFFRNLWIDGYHGLTIGDFVFINYGCMLQATGTIRIDDYVLLGPGVTILSANHDTSRDKLMRTSGAVPKPVHIEAEAWLGARCIITPGVTVGRGAIVAAGAVVTKNIEPYMIVGGVPAVVIGQRK